MLVHRISRLRSQCFLANNAKRRTRYVVDFPDFSGEADDVPVSPTNSSDVGRFMPAVMTVKVPSAWT
jgi:hypothetical protein